MECAFICHNPKLLKRDLSFILPWKNKSPKAGKAIYWHLSTNTKTKILPIYCPISKNNKKQRKILISSLALAQKNGCSLCAIEQQYRILFKHSPLPLYDGSIWAISQLKQLLDQEDTHWREKKIAIELRGNKSSAIARYLAQEVRYLHLFGQDSQQRKELAQIIYRECGLICRDSQFMPATDILILPPQKEEFLVPNITIWQNWPNAAFTETGEIIPLHWAEGILLTSLGEKEFRNWYRSDILEKLNQLARRSNYYGFTPICSNQEQNNSFICSSFRD
ncbi:MAG: hypothetical protein ACOX7H_04135 [Bacillota bacterium]|jgi:hypothetical protein